MKGSRALEKEFRFAVISMYRYTLDLGPKIAILGHKREQSCFKGSNEEAGGEHEGAKSEQERTKSE